MNMIEFKGVSKIYEDFFWSPSDNAAFSFVKKLFNQWAVAFISFVDGA